MHSMHLRLRLLLRLRPRLHLRLHILRTMHMHPHLICTSKGAPYRRRGRTGVEVLLLPLFTLHQQDDRDDNSGTNGSDGDFLAAGHL